MSSWDQRAVILCPIGRIRALFHFRTNSKNEVKLTAASHFSALLCGFLATKPGMFFEFLVGVRTFDPVERFSMKAASLISLLFAASATTQTASAIVNLSSPATRLEAMDACPGCLQRAVNTLGAEPAETQARELLQNVNVFGRDDRVPQTRRNQANGFAAIGRVVTNRLWKDETGRVIGQGTGTAFLVSPCVALTNYHVVFGGRVRETVIPDVRELNRQWRNRDSQGRQIITLPNDRDYSMTFMVGENRDGTFKRAVVGRPVAFGDDSLGEFARDWVAIKFDEPNCPGADNEIGWLPLDPSPNLRAGDRVLRTAGYPGRENPGITNRGTLFSTGTCRFLGQSGTGEHDFTHDCAARRGQSGSPIMITDANGRLTVVGIDQGSLLPERPGILPTYDHSSLASRENANIAVGVRALLLEVAPLIARDLAAHGSQFSRN